MDSPVLEILDDFFIENKLTRLTDLEINDQLGTVLIKNIEARVKNKGYTKEFLQRVKLLGYQTNIELPRRKALPFWIKMFERDLIGNDPASLESWEG